jgi:leucyl aminopeptidase
MLSVTNTTSFEKRKKADAIIIPFFEGKKQPKLAASACDKELKEFSHIISFEDFSAKSGNSLCVYPKKGTEPRIILLGLGDEKKCNTEELRRCYGAALQVCLDKKTKTVNLLAPQSSSIKEGEAVSAIMEGILSQNYHFSLKNQNKEPVVRVEKCQWVGLSKSSVDQAKQAVSIFDGVYLARDLINGNADDVSPQYLGSVATAMGKKHSALKVSVFNKKRIEKEKMDLLLAVSRSGNVDPAFIIMDYQGAPKSKDKTVLVGKGITYDTGGLNLKPTGSIETMKCDMGGAAAVIGTMRAICELKLPINVCGVVPSCENGIDAISYKPGDVYNSYKGLSVEIGNTDAEGRLVLADALAYACDKLSPSRIIDLATLTGAMVISLGDESSGMMSNDDKLAQDLSSAGSSSFERVWRFPLFEEYEELLKSDIADLKNIGGRAGGSITAALFLQRFIDEKTPWAHLDIAGTAYISSKKRYLPKNGTGFGVRLLIEYLKSI